MIGPQTNLSIQGTFTIPTMSVVTGMETAFSRRYSEVATVVIAIIRPSET